MCSSIRIEAPRSGFARWAANTVALKRGVPTGFNPFQLEPTAHNLQFCETLVAQLVKQPGDAVPLLSAKEQSRRQPCRAHGDERGGFPRAAQSLAHRTEPPSHRGQQSESAFEEMDEKPPARMGLRQSDRYPSFHGREPVWVRLYGISRRSRDPDTDHGLSAPQDREPDYRRPLHLCHGGVLEAPRRPDVLGVRAQQAKNDSEAIRSGGVCDAIAVRRPGASRSAKPWWSKA